MPPKRGTEDTRGAKAKEQKAKSAAEKKAHEDASKAVAEDAEWAAGANARALKKSVRLAHAGTPFASLSTCAAQKTRRRNEAC